MLSIRRLCTHKTTVFYFPDYQKKPTAFFAEYVTTSTCEGFNQAVIYIVDSPEQFTVNDKK